MSLPDQVQRVFENAERTNEGVWAQTSDQPYTIQGMLDEIVGLQKAHQGLRAGVLAALRFLADETQTK